MKSKVTFIIPYFGKLPNYFDLFLKSCEFNKDYSWIVFTDDTSLRKWPSNVLQVVMSFDELKKKIQSKFEFEIKITEPHKLCDYKPAYGYIFEEYLKESDYWGHCDIDTVLGNLDAFLEELFCQEFDKLFCLGHMEIYKNTYDNNRVFMLPVDGRYWYRDSFSSERTTVFDESGNGEENINTIYKAYNKRLFTEDLSMNCSVVPTRFVKVTYLYNSNLFATEETKDALYIFDKGDLYRLYKIGNKIVREDFLYIHLQLRKMKVNDSVLGASCFKILENQFALIENEAVLHTRSECVSVSEFKSIKRHALSFRFFQLQFKWKINKLKKILRG